MRHEYLVKSSGNIFDNEVGVLRHNILSKEGMTRMTAQHVQLTIAYIILLTIVYYTLLPYHRQIFTEFCIVSEWRSLIRKLNGTLLSKYLRKQFLLMWKITK